MKSPSERQQIWRITEQRYRRGRPGDKIRLWFDDTEQWKEWSTMHFIDRVEVHGRMTNPLTGRHHVWITK